jgi:Abnormal spindle-like microcephaly-assoc'd, ASPM-SPD-2-Hydin
MKLVRATSITSIAVFCLLALQAQLTAQDKVASWISSKDEITGSSEPSAELSPLSVNFGYVVTHTISSPQIVTLTNTSTSWLRILEIAITGTDTKDFAEVHTCGASLRAGASCSIEVTFEPLALGTRTALLSVTDNASDSPQTVSLSGIGIAGSCVKKGGQCPPWTHCCPGLVCSAASDRAFCVGATAMRPETQKP